MKNKVISVLVMITILSCFFFIPKINGATLQEQKEEIGQKQEQAQKDAEARKKEWTNKQNQAKKDAEARKKARQAEVQKRKDAWNTLIGK